MTDTIAPAAPAGWYDDPSDLAAFRWWSGAEWTTYTSPKPPPVVVPQPQSYASAYAPISRDPSVQRPDEFAPALAALPVRLRPDAGCLAARVPAVHDSRLLRDLVDRVPRLGRARSQLRGYAVRDGLAWFFGALDVRALRRRGYVPPSIALDASLSTDRLPDRAGSLIRLQGGKAWPAEVAYLGSLVDRGRRRC